MKRFFFVLTCTTFMFSIQNTNAQSFTPNVIGSAGAFATSGGTYMAWTIGEVITETHSSSGNYFTQGFHQPDTSFVISIIDISQQNIFIYPNPFINNVIVDFSASAGNYSLEIFDMQGQMLKKEFIPANQKSLTISFHEFANGVYFLNIIHAEKNLRSSYKINKAE